jgi:hypothetical protein
LNEPGEPFENVSLISSIPAEELGVGDGEGLGEGDGLGDGEGLGEGDGLGDGSGDGDGDGDGLLTSIKRLAVPVLPAESVAMAVMVWTPSLNADVSIGSVHVDVPVAACGELASIATATFATVPLSDAVPATVMLPVARDPGEGAEMVTAGGVVSQVLFLLQFGPPPGPFAKAIGEYRSVAVSMITASGTRGARWFLPRWERPMMFPSGWGLVEALLDPRGPR